MNDFMLGRLCEECLLFERFRVAIVNPPRADVLPLAIEYLPDYVEFSSERMLKFSNGSYIYLLYVSNLRSCYEYSGYEFERLYFDKDIKIVSSKEANEGEITKEAYDYICSLLHSQIYIPRIIYA